MAYQQNQPQLQLHRQPGIGQQPPQFQQPQFHQQPPQSQVQQQPAVGVQGGQPTTQQAWPPTQQIGSVPQQAAPQQTGGVGSQFPQQDSVPTTQQGLGQQLPQVQQPTPTQQFGQRQPQGSFGQLQPQGTFGQLQPQTVGQLGTQPAIPSSLPQGQTVQVPQMQAQQIPQQLGQQIPQQAQWGAQASGQPTGQSATSMGQSSTAQSVQPGVQSLPSQMPEFGTGSFQQVGEQAQQRLAGTPSIDIVDMPDEIVLFVDLPGYDEENIKIQADGQNLTVSAERRDEEQAEGQKFAQERPQKLQRTVRLPTRANVNEADATYENGVCKIRLPKMEEDKQHEIAFQ